jgi:hypothetical protein
MLRKLNTKRVTISARRDLEDLKTIFDENVTATVLRFVESTEVGTKPTDNSNRGDSWDIERLDEGDNEGTTSGDVE